MNHPNIVKIHEMGFEHGVPFIRLEYVPPGKTLADLLAARLPLEDYLRLYRQVLSAVAHAHEQGILHRDLKPGNILIDEAENARLTDFGLALVLGGEADDLSGRLTGTQEMLGTPAYMAPEQVTGHRKEIDSATDIWALGVILYQILTDQLPFENLAQISSAKPTPPSSIRPGIPRPLERVCLRALSSDRAARYRSCKQMLQELGATG